MLAFRTLIFAALVPGTVVIVIPGLILARNHQGVALSSGWLTWAGLMLLFLGSMLLAICFSSFVAEGDGTPAPYDPPRRLVSGLVYSWIRNPIYVGVVLVLVGEAALFRSLGLLVYAVAAWLLFHSFVVLYEEPTLRRRFGDAYLVYLKSVPRWLPVRRVWALVGSHALQQAIL